MEQQQPKQHSGHGNGFLFGVIVGVVITLLFSTKKGREILRDVSEKGIEKLSDLEKLTKEYEGKDFLEDELLEEDDYVKPEPKPTPEPAKAASAKETPKAAVKETPKLATKPSPQPEVEHEVIEPVEEKKPEKTITGRRWFRGLRKRG